MSRRCCPYPFFLTFLALCLCYHFQAGAQEAKKDDTPKKEAKKDATPKTDAPSKDDAKKDAAKKDETKKDEIKEEPKKEPFVPDTPVKELKGHGDWINALVISGDGKFIATASRDRTVKVWDIAAAKDVATLKGSPENVKGVVFLEGSTKVASSTGKWNKEKKYWEGEIKIWDAKAGKEIKSIKGHAETIEGLALSPDGRFLASASEDQTVKIWDLASGKDIQTLKGHTGPVEAVAFSSDGLKLATASADKTVRIWDAASGKELAVFKVEPPVKIPEPKAETSKKQELKKEEAKKEEKKDEAKKKDG